MGQPIAVSANSDTSCGFKESAQHLRAGYSQECERPKFCAGVDLDAARSWPVRIACTWKGGWLRQYWRSKWLVFSMALHPLVELATLISTAGTVLSFQNRNDVLELIELCFLPSHSDCGRSSELSSNLVTALNQSSSGAVVGFCPAPS
jgi:hypothetical protein